MEKSIINFPDIFVSGLANSGKDTISNYLKQYFGYRKMRLAKTIKTIICEKNDLTFDELEELKRTNVDFRLKHHQESEYLTKESSLIRAKQIAKRTSMDYECVSNPDKQIVVCDVRCADEAGILLENNFIGIFLSRTSDEKTDSTHYTENNLFLNGQLLGLIQDNPDSKFIVVLNGCDENDKKFIVELEKLLSYLDNDNLTLITFDEKPNSDVFLNKIDEIISNILDNE